MTCDGAQNETNINLMGKKTNEKYNCLSTTIWNRTVYLHDTECNCTAWTHISSSKSCSSDTLGNVALGTTPFFPSDW